jgi:diadenosine tetraphosphatase ApaH/serine/threonine PP2A family protein phosphatase
VLAALYDIHGNLPALEAVLADAEAAGADSFLLGGDYASLGAWPLETLERLRELPSRAWLRGNWERWQASPSFAPKLEFIQAAMGWVREALGADNVAALAALPETATLEGALFCHASPVSDMRTFMPEGKDDEAELLAGVVELRVVFGHSHLQFKRVTDAGVELVNPGSVGLPFDGDTRAAYALLPAGGEAELRRVEYDHDLSAATIRERMPGFGEDLARRIDTALPPG